MFHALEKEWVHGITFSGGHPLEEQNLPVIVSLIQEIRQRLPCKTIWLYTGFDLKFNDFLSDGLAGQALRGCDIVVDGRYIDSERDITLPFRGSSNQRVIDVQASIKAGEIVLWNGGDFDTGVG